MARQFYTQEEKNAIIKAATEARSAGKTWAEAVKAAQEAGYKSKQVNNLIKLLSGAGVQAAAGGGGARRKRGRPSKAEVAARNAAASSASAPAITGGIPQGTNEIEQLIQRVVQERINAAIEKAIEALRGYQI